MNFRDRRELKRKAEDSLAKASLDPKKLMLVYIGASAVLMLLVTALNFALDNQIAGTGGLSGLGLRSVLETVSQVVQTAVNLLLPFWTMGYLYCVLRMVRGEEVGYSDLLRGFRNFGPVLRLTVIRGIILGGLVMACLYLALEIFMLTPLGNGTYELLLPYVEAADLNTAMDEAALVELGMSMIPAFVIFGILAVVLVLPQYYGMRMADLALMDDPKSGAMAAIRRSKAMLHKNRLSLVALDLSFWWFYVLDGLLLVLCYGDLILPLLGVGLPFDADTAYFLFYILYLAAQVVLYVFLRNKVECTYAVGYEELNRDLEDRMKQISQRMPPQGPNFE